MLKEVVTREWKYTFCFLHEDTVIKLCSHKYTNIIFPPSITLSGSIDEILIIGTETRTAQ